MRNIIQIFIFTLLFLSLIIGSHFYFDDTSIPEKNIIAWDVAETENEKSETQPFLSETYKEVPITINEPDPQINKEIVNEPQIILDEVKIPPETSNNIPAIQPGPVSEEVTCASLEELNKKTPWGTDADGNGVRDDVDCYITEWFGSKPEMYTIALRHAESLQASLTGKILYSAEELDDKLYFKETNEPLKQQHHETFLCVRDVNVLRELSKVTEVVINTPERGSAYGNTFAGAFLSDIDPKYCYRDWMRE